MNILENRIRELLEESVRRQNRYVDEGTIKEIVERKLEIVAEVLLKLAQDNSWDL